MPDTTEVRSATPGDEPFLAAHDQHVRTDVLKRLIDAEQILVLETSGVLVGWLRWGLFWDEIPFMNMLFVLEPHRARGFGSALMDAWEFQSARDGHNEVMTSSQADEDAQHLYRKRGYEDCGALIVPSQAAELIFRKDLRG